MAGPFVLVPKGSGKKYGTGVYKLGTNTYGYPGDGETVDGKGSANMWYIMDDAGGVVVTGTTNTNRKHLENWIIFSIDKIKACAQGPSSSSGVPAPVGDGG